MTFAFDTCAVFSNPRLGAALSYTNKQDVVLKLPPSHGDQSRLLFLTALLYLATDTDQPVDRPRVRIRTCTLHRDLWRLSAAAMSVTCMEGVATITGGR